MKEVTLKISPEVHAILAAFGKKSGRTLTSILREGLTIGAEKYGVKLPDLEPSRRYCRRLAGPSVTLTAPSVAKSTADDLKRLAAQTGAPVSALVREALDSFVGAKLARKLKPTGA